MSAAEKSKDEQAQFIQQLRHVMGSSVNALSDDYMLQFLHANVWNLGDAQQQLKDTLAWRAANEIDMLPVATTDNKLPLLVSVRGYKSIQDGNLSVQPGISESALRIGNFIGGDCFHKFDKLGHPVLIDRTGYHNTKDLGSRVTTAEITNYQIACNEFLNRVIMPEASERAQQRINRETIIFDCSNLSIWQFHMNALYHLKSIADILQHYYPETLHRLFIVNVPTAFVAMWKVIKPWLNARTLDKVQILSKDEVQHVLLEHIHAKDLPSFLGGTCNVPSLTAMESNDKVPTVYNSDIMRAAKSDPSLRRLHPEH